MSTTQGLGDMVRAALARSYTLKMEDLGADARLAKKGMVFDRKESPG